MSLTSAEVAHRFGGSRPGFELVAVEEVGVPFFKLVLEVVVQEPSPLPTIEEFVLRAVASGLDLPEDVAGLLGLESSLVEQAVVNQSHEDHLDYQWDPTAGMPRLAIKPLGIGALEEANLVRQRREISIGFDRLLWTPTGRRTSQLVLPKDAADLNLIEIPPTSKKRLKASDLDKDSVDRAIRELPIKGARRTELLAMTNVTNRRAFLPGFALVYAADDGSGAQVALVVDGRLSDEHERAFADMEGPQRCGLVVQDRAREAEWGRIPQALAAEALDRQQVKNLQHREAVLEEDLENTRTATAALGDVRASSLDSSREGELSSAAAELNTQIQSPPAREIQTYEHDDLLALALAGAQDRLVILSPRISAAVVTTNFVQRLERLCRNHVAVTIGWGASNRRDDNDCDAQAFESLARLSSGYRNFDFEFVGPIDPKVLLWDNNLVVSSFNWLSYREEKGRRYRQEIGALIIDNDYVEEQYHLYRRQAMRSRE